MSQTLTPQPLPDDVVAREGGGTPLAAVIKRSLDGKIEIAPSWGVTLFSKLGRQDGDATALAGEYEALHKQSAALRQRVAGAPQDLLVPRGFSGDLDGVGAWMERIEKDKVGHTPEERAKVSALVKAHAQTLTRLDGELTGWLSDRGDQDALRVHVRGIVAGLDTIRIADDVDDGEVEVIWHAFSAVAEALDQPRLKQSHLDQGRQRLADATAVVEASGVGPRERNAQQLRDTAAAMKPPPGATDGEGKMLATLRQGVADALPQQGLTSADCQAGMAAFENLSEAWARINKAVEARRDADAALRRDADALAERLNDQLGAACDRERAAKADVARALAAWHQAFARDGQATDPDVEQAARDALTDCVHAATDWRVGINDQHDAVLDALSGGSASDLAEAGKQADAVAVDGDDALARAERVLAAQVKLLGDAVQALDADVRSRLSDTDELMLTNAFKGAKPRPGNDRGFETLANGLGSPIPDLKAKMPNVLQFLAGLASQGEALDPVKVSRQKPTEALKAALVAADPALEAVFNDSLREQASALERFTPAKTLALARALQASGAGREDQRWLVRLVLKGADVATLPNLLAARDKLQSMPIDTQVVEKLNGKWSDPTFPTTLNDLFTRKKSPSLFGAGLRAYLQTDSTKLAINVCEDFYGLLGPDRPYNVESRIGEGLNDGVITIKQEKTTAGGSGHMYKFTYIGGAPGSLFELHVHQKPGTNWYPAWKYVANPYEKVDKAIRSTHTIHGTLRGHL